MRAKCENVRFGCWVPPMPDGNYLVPGSFITEERYREAKDMGLDFLIGHIERGPQSADVKKALQCAAATGLKYIIRWEDMIQYMDSSPEELRNALGDSIEHEACMGVLVYDEPKADKFPMMGKLAELYRQVSDKYFYVNLFPFDAGEDLLGTPTYAEHLALYDRYLKNDMVSMDIYPLRKKKGGYYVSACFLRNLEEIQNLCRKKQMEHWQFVQGSMAYGISKAPDYFDMRLQIYTSLCYGATVLQYYCYCTPPIKAIMGKSKWTSMLDSYGNKTARYRAAKRLNAEVHGMGSEFMQYAAGWRGVMPVVGSENPSGKNEAFDMLETPLQSHEDLISVAASQDTIIGAFDGQKGENAFMLVNYTVPAYRIQDSVHLTFRDATKVIYYRAGKKYIVSAPEGRFDLTLAAGEGVFVIPVRE